MLLLPVRLAGIFVIRFTALACDPFENTVNEWSYGKMRAKEEEPAEMPDWLLNDIGLRRSDLPRKRRWSVDRPVDDRPESAARDWGLGPAWRRE